MFPYLDVPGFKRRTVLPFEYIDEVEAQQPGYTAQCISMWSSQINARLAKRYRRTGHLPLGQKPPALLASGTTPPPVSLIGRPTLGSMQIQIFITTGGALGTAAFKWSYDKGLTFSAPITTAANVVLNATSPQAPLITGVTAEFPSNGTYGTDNVYMAAPPVPETVLGWICALVNPDILRRRGISYTDPQMVIVMDERKRALDEIMEAANTNTGLYDLPISEDLESNISAGGPRSYSEQSPYTWAYKQEARALLGGSLDALFVPNKLIGD